MKVIYKQFHGLFYCHIILRKASPVAVIIDPLKYNDCLFYLKPKVALHKKLFLRTVLFSVSLCGLLLWSIMEISLIKKKQFRGSADCYIILRNLSSVPGINDPLKHRGIFFVFSETESHFA